MLDVEQDDWGMYGRMRSHFRLALDGGYYVTGGTPTVRSPASGQPPAESGKRMAQSSLPPTVPIQTNSTKGTKLERLGT
jgi:hypothetical protein